MGTYIAKRFIQGMMVMLAASMICFVIFQYSGDPALNMVGQYATFQEINEVRELLGLDKPVYIQYGKWLFNAIQGNFGVSYRSKVPALGLILERFPATFELVSIAVFMAFCIGVSLGVVVALKPNALVNRIIMAGSLGGISIPTFLIGTVLIMIFAVYLELLPAFGRGNTVQIGFWRTGLLTVDGWIHLILPATTLVMYQLAVLLRLTRAGMREVLTEDYIKTAWSKGLAPKKVIFKHALRNVLIPIVTITGLQFGELIAFSLITETIFQWPGMGSLLLTSIYETDQSVIVTYIMIAAFIIISANIIVDILYAVINPKVRYE